jgi:putative phage-type endonuclease
MDRTTFIGGSDSSVIVGLSPFKDADELVLEKAGLKAPDDSRFAGHKTWGTLIEPLVMQYTADQLKLEILPTSAPRHPEYPFLSGELDGLILGDPRGGGVYEGKCTAHSQKAKWKDGPPPEYRIQLVHYFLVTGLTWGVIAVLIGGNDYRRFEIQRDEEEVQLLLTLELRFWAKVEALRKECPV